jgi:hypothetical protein
MYQLQNASVSDPAVATLIVKTCPAVVVKECVVSAHDVPVPTVQVRAVADPAFSTVITPEPAPTPAALQFTRRFLIVAADTGIPLVRVVAIVTHVATFPPNPNGCPVVKDDVRVPAQNVVSTPMG